MAARTTTTLPSKTLTAREMQVLNTLCTGASNQEIAAELVMSIRTVNSHFTNISNKLEIFGDRQLMAFWYKTGYQPAG